MEAVRMQQQQEEQMRLKQEREEQMRREQEEMMRRQQEEMKRQEAEQLRLEQMRQQEQEQRQRQEQEEIFRQAEMKRQEEERQMQQQMQMQQQQEQMIIQQQREQQQQMQMQQQQQVAQQQQMQFQQQQVQTSSMTSQEQKISSITKAGGFSYGAIPTKQPKSQPQEAALPPMSSSFESSQSQQFTSVQQSSSSFSAQQQSKSEIYESQEFNGGVMKGYRRKDEASTNGSHGARDSGIFTGINGDANSLVDETFDYKKHTVKDLAAHFALVKPKQNIPSNILPEQRNYNGGQAPQLNYLGANEAGATVTSQQTTRRELSQQDIEASKQAYEMKKKQQMEAKQTTTTTTTTDSSSVVRRTTETSSEQKSERRMSLRDSLMLDPAQAHADAGLIDPSAILRGEAVTHWKTSTEGMNQSSVEGETDKVLNKWDNHNTIARGWTGVKANYHPVTFRNIYNVDTQKNESSFQL